MIKINALNKFYNRSRSNELHVLNNVSLDLPECGMVAIFGRSGCGKTTLLNAIGGLDNTSSGEVLIDGERVYDGNDVIRNKYIGYIFQNYNLNMSRTCFENVADALRLCGVTDAQAIQARVLAALKNVGLENYKSRTPDTLSGGQMQRIAIARAIVKNPKIILADEPTGNLDEANTVMIMDLLKQISQTHLVILVTHEAKLVDHYCDRVIELADGRVVGDKSNANANGYSAKSKNDIYLGELEKITLSDKSVNLELYGALENTDIKLRIVSYQGKTYLSIDTQGIQVLDSSSEVKLREGVYISEKEKNELSGEIDMSALPPLTSNDANAYGKLFGFKNSLKSGFDSVMSKKKKKANKLMRRCMLLFAFVIVFISSLQGTVFKQYADAKSNYNQNVFYVYTALLEGDKLMAAVGSHGIDYTRINTVGYGDDNISFSPGQFESYGQSGFSSGIYANAVIFPHSMCEGLEALAGSAEYPTNGEIILTSAVADKIIASSSLGYIEEYDDVIGFVCRVKGRSLIVKGVVNSSETSVYVSKDMLEDMVPIRGLGANVEKGSDYKLNIADGDTVLFIASDELSDSQDFPNIGESINIFGREHIVSNIIKVARNYESYLESSGRGEVIKTFKNYHQICCEKVQSEHPELEGEALEAEVNKLYEATYYQARLDYYAYADEYFATLKMTNRYGYEIWLYENYGFEIAKYLALSDTEMACVEYYRSANGRLPTLADQEAVFDYKYMVYHEIDSYYNEYDIYMSSKPVGIDDYVYLLSDDDYYKCTFGMGLSDDTVFSHIVSHYTLVHTNDYEATKAYLESEFPEESLDYYKRVITPEYLLESELEMQKDEMTVGFLTLLIFIVVLSVCVYFIMRSALMGRVKEIGIYRAIGVSKKNLIFKFFIETLVLTTLTVFVGYFISTFLITNWISSSSIIAEILYFPAWLAITVLVLLYGVCTVSGMIPIFTLLRKTPSEILAKYDI